MKKIREYIKNIDISDDQLAQFDRYYEMLVEKNKVMNLTAITERDKVILKHFVDSIALSNYYDLKDQSIIDIGTGAGFPGLPLKILIPTLEVTLFDSLNKRVLFLNDVINELGLTGIRAIHGRAEDGGRDRALRESFDLAVSRAVANMSVLSEYCLPFVKPGGYFIAYKTDKVDEELSAAGHAISTLGGKLEKVEKLDISGLGRSFVFVKKQKPTPKAYPRKAGTANKQPL